MNHRAALALLLVTATPLLIAGCGESPDSGPAPARSEITSTEGISDPELVGLRRQASELLDGGVGAFRRRLAELRGNPVVVNQWASWCGPCRYEFPFFQRQAIKHGARVAFLGVDSKDNRDDAKEFLRQFPTPFPHYFDPDSEIARTFKGGRAWPTTAFYAADGRLVFTHAGAYADEQQLEAEIRTYALNG